MDPETQISTQDPAVTCPDDFLRMLCHHAGVAVVGTDSALRIQFWNPAAARMFGAGAEQMTGVHVLSVVPQEDRAKADAMLQQALHQGEIGGFEFCSRDNQGHRRQLAATVSPVVDDEGVIIGTSACIRDITRRMLLEEKLAHNRKMASLGAMAGAMAHFFNNILGGVITSVDFALVSGDAALQQRALEKAAESLARAAALGDSLLTFAEGDFRTADLADLTETVIETASAVERELKGSKVKFEIHVDPIPVTPIPGVQFRTALNNVIHNAIEAMPDGGKLTIGLAPIENGYRVSVTDTGCGILKEELERIFEPFYSTKTGDAAGGASTRAGLGLAVAHGILQVLGGTISVQSTIGLGSTFEIRVPTKPKLPIVC